ncbi:hypothetical protein PR048_015595 [Dryococelus australis]|uniref:Uncharacterized protein n=1 Tax=Dryococelus australis TaxID=614101 RepID=A0ABQ9HHC9_9NEOP|nr:hypothetical protein PR048_015595 [Dryococelus australis]
MKLLCVRNAKIHLVQEYHPNMIVTEVLEVVSGVILPKYHSALALLIQSPLEPFMFSIMILGDTRCETQDFEDSVAVSEEAKRVLTMAGGNTGEIRTQPPKPDGLTANNNNKQVLDMSKRPPYCANAAQMINITATMRPPNAIGKRAEGVVRPDITSPSVEEQIPNLTPQINHLTLLFQQIHQKVTLLPQYTILHQISKLKNETAGITVSLHQLADKLS